MTPVKVNKNVAIPMEYSLTESLPHIAKNLGYDNLILIKTPERLVYN